MFAGTDTTSNTLTYLFWELTRHKDWQARLQVELQSVKVENGVVAFKEVSNLPILDAVVNESLRVHPAAPSSLPRETPKEGTLLAGYFVPAGVSLCHISFLNRSFLTFPGRRSYQHNATRPSATPTSSPTRTSSTPRGGSNLRNKAVNGTHCSCPSAKALVLASVKVWL